MLSPKVALITGAGRGIGCATAELFAREGASVVLCSRTKQQLAAVMTTITSTSSGGQATARVADIGIAREADALVRIAVKPYGRLDYLINNAGVLGPQLPILEYPHRDWTQVLRINLLSGTFLCRKPAPWSWLGKARAVSLSSSVGRRGRSLWGAYARYPNLGWKGSHKSWPTSCALPVYAR